MDPCRAPRLTLRRTRRSRRNKRTSREGEQNKERCARRQEITTDVARSNYERLVPRRRARKVYYCGASVRLGREKNCAVLESATMAAWAPRSNADWNKLLFSDKRQRYATSISLPSNVPLFPCASIFHEKNQIAGPFANWVIVSNYSFASPPLYSTEKLKFCFPTLIALSVQLPLHLLVTVRWLEIPRKLNTKTRDTRTAYSPQSIFMRSERTSARATGRTKLYGGHTIPPEI